jgi:enoyl-CoA hydratase
VSGEEIPVSRLGAIGRIRLNRPKALNALTFGMARRFAEALEEFASDPAVIAVLVDGVSDGGQFRRGDSCVFARGRFGFRDGRGGGN